MMSVLLTSEALPHTTRMAKLKAGDSLGTYGIWSNSSSPMLIERDLF
jgi:hypothetical protein